MAEAATNSKGCTAEQQQEYLDYKGVCALLRVTYGTARNWKSSGKLAYTTCNGKVLFPKKSIMKQLRKNTIRSTHNMLEEISH